MQDICGRVNDMNATDIIAYTYDAEMLCPGCTVQALRTYQSVPVQATTTEGFLDMLAVDRGINRYDEREFDSGDFPKVVFADQVEDAERCGSCGRELI
jgi:hypothetical protein